MNKLYFFFFLFLLYSCANEVAPSGGEKDITPPKLKKANPNNGNINFDSKKIELRFNEFIKFKSSSEYIFISPPLSEKPKYILNGKKVTIQFKEDLLENTTYSINFNEAIEDFNEGNKINSFNYVFSTGDYIDSLSISGNVLDAFDNKPIENILVLLYSADQDSILYKRPQYFAKTNAEGNYILNNLKAGQYKIACLEDKNLNYIFDQNNERLSFSDEIIDLSENVITIPFYLFQDNKENGVLDNSIVSPNHLKIDFKNSFSLLNLDISDYNQDDIVYFSKDKKSIHYWFQDKDTTSDFTFDIDGSLDTLKLDLRDEISLDSSFSLTISQYLLNEKSTILLESAFPISALNEDKIKIKTNKGEFLSFNAEKEKNNLNLVLSFDSDRDSLSIDISENAIISFNNKGNKAVSEELIGFEAIKTNLILNIPQQEQTVVIQLYNNDLVLIDSKIVSRETSISFNKINAGKYIIRIFEDLNNNGRWDSGMFHVKQFPEKTLFYSSEIDLKANWDKELDLQF